MADIKKIKDKITSTIYPNGKGAINATDHQAMLLEMADGMAETDAKLTELSAKVNELGNINAKPMISVTYAELVALRDNGELVAGMQYRITDFVTTTAQENTRSAGHQFDVIVTADNENTLNEVARACLHEGDTYFSEAGAKLAAWQIWYSLDNDAERFAWALHDNHVFAKIYYEDDTNDFDKINGSTIRLNRYSGEDVFIEGSKLVYQYWLSNEISLDCTEDGSFYYDGDVLYGTFVVQKGKGVIYRMIDEWNNDVPYDFKNIMFKRYILEAADAFATDVAKGGEIDIVKEKLQEMSHKIHTNLWYYGEYISDVYPDANPEVRYVPFGDVNYDNVGPQVLCEIDENNYGWFYTFHNEGEDASLLELNVDENIGVHDNTIKDSCYVFLVEEGAGSYYPSKINAQSLNNIVFVGNDCNFNSFGNYCSSNSFGNNCNYNSFGNNCYSNSFGNYCSFNSFGNYCYFNSFGNNCYYNSFGNNCNYNSFGNNCNYNTFIDDSDGPAHDIKYCRYDDGVHDVRMYYDDLPDAYDSIMNIHIYRGVHDVSYTPQADTEVEQSFCCNYDGEVVPFRLVDIITKVNNL